MIQWEKNNANGNWAPTNDPYPSNLKREDYALPDGISTDFHRLNGQIEYKYQRERVKIMAFYNKMFPTLKSWDWSYSSHNALPFSVQEQERFDTNTGISENWLKAIVDKVVARVANVHFEVKLKENNPSLLMEIYKEPVEKHLRMLVKNNKLVRLVTEIFHDAAILGFGHFFVDPWSGDIRKIADWEVGFYESEFSLGPLAHCLIRDFGFPTCAIGPYVKGMDEERLKSIVKNRPNVDLKLYMDTQRHKAWATVDSYTLPAIDYPFDEVLLSTYSFDLGIKSALTASMFDLLYPSQRAIAKLNAKKTQLIDQYKGPVPVFNNDCDVIVKSMGNGAGEALFLASGRNPSEVLTVLNPTPLDPEMNAEKTNMKTTMEELAGVQEMSLDMENIRSAATVIALNQLHDQIFQSQLVTIGDFVSDTLTNSLMYAAKSGANEIDDIPWLDIVMLLADTDIQVEVVHNNDPNNQESDAPPDYELVVVNRAVMGVMRGRLTWEDIKGDYTIDPVKVKGALAKKLIDIKATTGKIQENIEKCLLDAFIDDVATGVWAM
jgi:hypothetical protein